MQQGIADHYTRQMPKILAKVNSLVAREEYEDAMAALAVIPECRRIRGGRGKFAAVYDKLLAGEVTVPLPRPIFWCARAISTGR